MDRFVPRDDGDMVDRFCRVMTGEGAGFSWVIIRCCSFFE
jgi:hypothetical protein